MKISIIFSTLFAVAVAQEPSLSCDYYDIRGTYSCYLSIYNPNGFNNFTEIGGSHLEGFTNENVMELLRINGVSSIVPSIICDTFPNLVRIILDSTGLTSIGDSAFSGCSLVTKLSFYINRITSISTNTFANHPDLTFLELGYNMISTLPDNVFTGQQSLTFLGLSNNPFNDIPSGIFGPLQNLCYLELSNTNVTTINNQWFVTNKTSFELKSLQTLRLRNNAINEVPVGTFAGLTNLRGLYLSGNNFTEVQADSFVDLGQLTHLDISNNTIEIIHDGAFRGLSKLRTLKMDRCRLRQVQSSYFDDLGNLTSLSLNYNEIDELPEDVFVAMPNLFDIDLRSNRLKTIRRHSFGTLTSLEKILLDDNIVNAFDREIIDDAVNLSIIQFYGNLCASGYFPDFAYRRPEHLLALDKCFRNMLYCVDTVTEAGDDYSFFEAPQPGLVLRVNTTKEVQIALSPLNATLTPIFEILIGTENNTRSIIRLNQETNEVNASTPNIIIENQWNDFRVTWENQFLFVFSGNNTYPFMGFTMQNFFPINFYGLRSVETRATWTVRPLD